MTDSQHLLADYRRNGSDAIFRELVSRYVDLVYSTALRLVEGDTHRAEDVTQTVFVDLARQARTLPAEVRLGGWLHRHTCFVAANTLRGERRRQSRERQAAEMNALQNQSAADFSQLAPLLDEAINELGEADRTAILLRFFEQQDFRAVGQALGSNEDAARMRVTRALEKLEEFLKRRGFTTSAASLGVVLTANAVQAAPVGLVVTISTAAALAGTTSSIATQATMNWLNLKSISAIVVAAVAAGTGTHLVQKRETDRLRSENQNLVAQQEQLTGERDTALAAAAGKDGELQQPQKDKSELLRLRGEVGLLRRQTKDLEKLRDENRQLRAAQASVNQPAEQPAADPEDTPERRVAIAKMSDAKMRVLGLIMYADDHEGRLPTEFNQVSKYWGDSEEMLLNTNQFELVVQGSLTDITNRPATIVVREKDTWIWNGHRQKAYGFADGHSEIKREPPEGFAAWEQQHMVPSPASP
jgi:RNA polymerase sigma factor (sigma-70 family)